MKQRTYIDGQLVDRGDVSVDEVRDLVLGGHRVIGVDEGGIAVEITRDMVAPQPNETPKV